MPIDTYLALWDDCEKVVEGNQNAYIQVEIGRLNIARSRL
jgi:hypothetical protein